MFIIYTLRIEPWSNSSTSYPPAIQELRLSGASNRPLRLSPANGEDEPFFDLLRARLPTLDIAFTLAEYGSVCAFTISE